MTPTENEARTPSELLPPPWLLPALETIHKDPCFCDPNEENLCGYCNEQNALDAMEDENA